MPEPNYQVFGASFQPLQNMASAQQALASSQQMAGQYLAGNQIAQGNLQGGVNSLYASGNIPAAQQEQVFGNTAAGASAMAARNYGQAASSFGQAGDTAGVQTAQQGQMQQYSILAAAANKAMPDLLGAYRQGGAQGLSSALGSVITPYVQSGAISSDTGKQLVSESQSDPEGTLFGLHNFIQKYNYQQIGPNTALQTDALGNPVAVINGQTTTSVAPGANLVQMPPSINGSPITGGASAPASQGTAAANAAPAPDSSGAPSSGYASAPVSGAQPVNNPGNLRPVGATTGFMQYSSPEAGLVALSDDLNAKAKDGITTLPALAAKYAPPGENNTQAWMQTVAQTAGIADQNAKIDLSNPNTRAAIIGGIVKAEGNAGATMGGSQPTQTTGTGISQISGPNGTTVITNNQGILQGPALDNEAMNYILTGKMTNSGRGALGNINNTNIQNRAQQIQQQNNWTNEDVRQMRVTAGAAQNKLGTLSLQQAELENNENNAITNGTLVLNLATAGLANTGLKTVNDIINYARSEGNNPALGSLDVALQHYNMDITKSLFANASGNGTSGTQADREEQAELLSPSDTMDSLTAKINQNKTALMIRSQTLAQQMAHQTRVAATGVEYPQEAPVPVPQLPGSQQPTAAPSQGSGAGGAAAPNVIMYNAQGQRISAPSSPATSVLAPAAPAPRSAPNPQTLAMQYLGAP